MEKTENEFDLNIMRQSWTKAEVISKEKNIKDLSLTQNLAITFFIQSMNFIRDNQRRNIRGY